MLSGSGFDERAVRMLASIEPGRRDEAAPIESWRRREGFVERFSKKSFRKVDGSFAESEFVRGRHRRRNVQKLPGGGR